jgi:uncharacterized membrane protein YsdA (DUF1294 family)
MSILTFITYGIDKYKAIKHKRRISEKSLLFLGLLLGGIGAFLAMITFRHKTNRLKFKLLNLLFIILHVLIGIYLNTLGV